MTRGWSPSHGVQLFFYWDVGNPANDWLKDKKRTCGATKYKKGAKALRSLTP